MKDKEYFEVLVNGDWKKVKLEGKVKECSTQVVWAMLEKDYGYENVRLVRKVM